MTLLSVRVEIQLRSTSLCKQPSRILCQKPVSHQGLCLCFSWWNDQMTVALQCEVFWPKVCILTRIVPSIFLFLVEFPPLPEPIPKKDYGEIIFRSVPLFYFIFFAKKDQKMNCCWNHCFACVTSLGFNAHLLLIAYFLYGCFLLLFQSLLAVLFRLPDHFVDCQLPLSCLCRVDNHASLSAVAGGLVLLAGEFGVNWC